MLKHPIILNRVAGYEIAIVPKGNRCFIRETPPRDKIEHRDSIEYPNERRARLAFAAGSIQWLKALKD